MKYDIISAKYESSLCQEIERKLSEGWELHGSPFAVVVEDRYWVQQAIVKKEPITQLETDIQFATHTQTLLEKYDRELSETYRVGHGLTISRAIDDFVEVLNDIRTKQKRTNQYVP